ncbi:N-acetylmuramoyl-L-alanine amidase family protein [Lachnobacterium bovis]|uniref:N-acetylmuramoyl-L-alanine amidase n=1 Tax=Lachnobacterium bovis TaxID=140626 RepID=A0A1H9NYW9_9FIRM|nr:N-acetylmuramoyl-L-alanine amidase [Lachnobacterium bovis]SER41132.1 N-acetylmuramoyl-L-alanine amidase [Lachnobacterium bovis]
MKKRFLKASSLLLTTSLGATFAWYQIPSSDVNSGQLKKQIKEQAASFVTTNNEAYNDIKKAHEEPTEVSIANTNTSTKVDNSKDGANNDISKKITNNVVTMDGDGNTITTNSIEKALADADQDLGKYTLNPGESKLQTFKKTYQANRNIVIVLDPGHDATHGGTSAGGMAEADINFDIAVACRDELRKYSGVTVYMTRNSASCPHPGTSSGDDNYQRVVYAKSVGATAYIALHCNMSSNAGANGAEVYAPNYGLNSTIGQIGHALSQAAVNELAKLGLHNGGVRTRNSENGTKYADGSIADYYGVIKNSKLNGFPGIIIEHGYQSNAYDMGNFLGPKSGRTRLGIADATAIAKYYGLTKGLSYEGVNMKPVFDKEYYANKYPDLKKAFGNDEMALYRHFIDNGMNERRQASANFDVKSYYNEYSDLRGEFGKDWSKYYKHFAEFGSKEGRHGTGCTSLKGFVTKYKGKDYSKVYDGSYYVEHNADLKGAFGTDEFKLIEHFVNNGMREGRRANENFDVKSYKNANSDLRDSFGNDFVKYFDHYMTMGYKENRVAVNCNEVVRITSFDGKDYSKVYNYNYYMDKYPDLKNYFKDDDYKALEHFVKFGINEKRQAIANFDIKSYINANSDLRAAYRNDFKAYVNHYISMGFRENRTTTNCDKIYNPVTTYKGVDYSKVYNYEDYIAFYEDIRKAFDCDDYGALEHFVRFGMNEKRKASSTFDVVSYKNANSDLRAAFKNDMKKYYEHYMLMGYRENRTTTNCSEVKNPVTTYKGVDYSDVYDYNYYVNNNCDIKNAFGGDDALTLEHFVKCGMREGRQASATFNVKAYANNYSDLRAAFGNDLTRYYMHYINNGKYENRKGV